MKLKKSFFYATATLIGTIIGAGIFGLPFAISKLGYFPSIVLLIFLAITTVINSLTLMEIILRTPGNNYFCNLANIYLGKKGKWFELIVLSLSNLGSILVYLVVGSAFLETIFQNTFEMPKIIYLLSFLLIASIFIYKGFEDLGAAEIVMFLGLLAIVFLITLSGATKIDFNHFLTFDFGRIFSSFGIMLFALNGLSGIFIIKNILTRNRKRILLSVITSYFFVVFIYLVFTTSIVGVMGFNVHPEGIIGISRYFSIGIEKSVVIFGVFAVFSSLIVIGSALKHTLNKDFKLPHLFSWIIVWALPLFFYLLGLDNFIDLISLIGIVFGAINSFIILILLKKARKYGKRKPEFTIKLPITVNYLIVIMYLIAMIFEVTFFIRG